MVTALRRFGLPRCMINMVQNIYEHRLFKVVNGKDRSSQRCQNAGISQGCPLSPFLFVMLMSVLAQDVCSMLSQDDQARFARGDLTMVLYADDTLLLGEQGPPLDRFL